MGCGQGLASQIHSSSPLHMTSCPAFFLAAKPPSRPNQSSKFPIQSPPPPDYHDAQTPGTLKPQSLPAATLNDPTLSPHSGHASEARTMVMGSNSNFLPCTQWGLLKPAASFSHPICTDLTLASLLWFPCVYTQRAPPREPRPGVRVSIPHAARHRPGIRASCPIPTSSKSSRL